MLDAAMVRGTLPCDQRMMMLLVEDKLRGRVCIYVVVHVVADIKHHMGCNPKEDREMYEDMAP